MEAPAPASALIHSATLVSAGIYLLVRINNFFFCEIYWTLVFGWGSLTALYGSIVAGAQTDFKKLLAYSTISHCGVLISITTLNNNVLLFYYLIGHGFYKSISFFCAGNIINSHGGYQDIRKHGVPLAKNNIDYLILSISMINLAGIPFTFGFLFKFYFLNLIGASKYLLISNIYLILLPVTSVFYSINLIRGSFFSIKKGHHSYYKLVNITKTEKCSKYMYYLSNNIVYSSALILTIFTLSSVLSDFYYYYIEVTLPIFNFITYSPKVN